MVDPVYKGELEPGAKGEVAQVEEEAMPDTVVVVTVRASPRSPPPRAKPCLCPLPPPLLRTP